MEYLKKIIHFLAMIIYVFIFVYALVCIPILFKYNPLVVLTGSMEPTFKIGSVIYYKEINENELKVGDIITFKVNNDKLVSHRIISIENGLIETKGDANRISDASKVRFEDIQGRDAKVCIPYVGYYIQWINENLTVTIVFTVIILVSEFLFSNVETLDIDKEEGRRDDNEKEK